MLKLSCPKCRSTASFSIEVTSRATIDGKAPDYIDVRQEESTPRLDHCDWISCDECDHDGTIAEFRRRPTKRAKGGVK